MIRTRNRKFVPLVLAGLFFVLSLVNVLQKSPLCTDAARHALNGAFLYDILRTGNLLHPMQYGLKYYSHLPGITLPYHPPGYPLLEAGFFSLLGVHAFSGRLVVSLAVALCCILYFRLVFDTEKELGIAIASVLTVFSLPVSMAVATDLMLEYPSFIFVLGAILCVRSAGTRKLTLREAVGFGILGTASVWTKQHAVFLLGVPVLIILLRRQWVLLRDRNLYLGLGIFTVGSALCAALALGTVVAMPTPMLWKKMGLLDRVFENTRYYYSSLLSVESWKLIVVLICILLAGVALVRARRIHQGNTALYAAWTISIGALLVCIPPRDVRYLFFLFPAVVVLIYSWFWSCLRSFISIGYARTVLAAVCLATLAISASSFRYFYLSGPYEAAQLVKPNRAKRVLYCGFHNGAFLFAVREADSDLETAVFRGDKIDTKVFERANFDQFAHRFGIEMVFIETDVRWQPWQDLLNTPPSTMVLEQSIPLINTDRLRPEKIHVFRYLNPSKTPEKVLAVPSYTSGKNWDLTF